MKTVTDHWADTSYPVHRYMLDDDGQAMPPDKAILGVGDYAEEGEPDLSVVIHTPTGLEDAVDVIRDALQGFLDRVAGG
jgi:hypothetical protein